MLKQTLDEVLQGAKGFAESVKRLHEFGDIFFSEEFLEARPLLKALREERGCVLLIDEVDKSDHGVRIAAAGDPVGLSGVDPGDRHREGAATRRRSCS